jgi:hypothetical protein
MYTSTTQQLNPHTLHVALFREGDPLSVQEVFQSWETHSAFRVFYLERMLALPFDAYRWETPPVTRDTLDRPFEFVAIDAPYLDRAPKRADFSDHFARAASEDRVVEFLNLGGDAWLIVPTPLGSDPAYPHLGAFTRGAPLDQQHALWERVGKRMRARCNAAPLWLSTAGDGVPWLHIRLDSRPKYYQHRAYRTP